MGGSRVKGCIVQAVQRIGCRESYFSVLRRTSHILIYTRTRAFVYDWLEDVLRLVGVVDRNEGALIERGWTSHCP